METEDWCMCDPDIAHGGRLSRYHQAWERLGDPYVTTIIRHGIQLQPKWDVTSKPAPVNNKEMDQEMEWMLKEKIIM